VNGVLATGAGLGAGHFIALVAPAASPIIAVATRFIDLTPGPVKDWAKTTLGTADKPVLVVGAIIVTLGLGALVGLIARWSTRWGLVAGALLVAIAIAAAGADPARDTWWFAPGIAALLVGGWALNRLVQVSGDRVAAPALRDADGSAPQLLREPDTDGSVLGEPVRNPAAAPKGRARREWIRLALGVGGLGAVGGLVGQLPQGSDAAAKSVVLPTHASTPLPAGLETKVPGLSPFVTPNSTFYRIDTALSPPSLDIKDWKLSVEGMVDHPYTLTWDELLALDAIERPVTLECVSNEVGEDLIGSAQWRGVRTSELLKRAGVQSGADMVLSSSIDNFSVSTPLGALLDDRDALVVYAMNGEPLPPKHGFPVRLLTPGLYGFVGATKWLVKMEVTTFAAKQAYWTKLGWSDHGPIKPSSRIEVPRPGVSVKVGSVTVGGTAWAHGVGVGKVQVRVDGGPWADATLGPDVGIEYWRQWIWTWDSASGEHELQVRVVDAAGKPQDEALANAFPNGSSGLHTIKVTAG
jgi:DMSO/TMAO reductase YedYZ molybdopterin-dependent catalytic subunit